MSFPITYRLDLLQPYCQYFIEISIAKLHTYIKKKTSGKVSIVTTTCHTSSPARKAQKKVNKNKITDTVDKKGNPRVCFGC